MEEALHDVPLFRDFAGLGGWDDRLPDESTILRFRHLLENTSSRPRSSTVNDCCSTRGCC
jgi:IS5 family transposase